MEAALRTDESFASKAHPQHHHGDSPLSDLNIGMTGACSGGGGMPPPPRN